MADLSSLSDDALLSALGPSQEAAHTPAAFVAQHAGTAQAAGQKLGVDPNLLLAQWGLESGWGKSTVPGTNNLGNIKDMSGGGVQARDNATGSVDNYRQYDSPIDFANDQASLLSRKYPGVVGAGSDVSKFAAGLHGYAQDPQYPQKLAAVVQTVQRSQPPQGFLARAGDAVASAISGTANAATPQDLSGISNDDLLAALSSRGVAPTGQPAASSQQQPSIAESALRQLGLTARAVGHGVADAAGLVGNPINATINAAGRAIGHDPQLQDVDTLIRQGVDAVTPAPQNSTERVVGDISGALANPVNLAAGPIMAGAGGLASTLGRGALAGAVTNAAQPVHEGDGIGTVAGRAATGAVGGALGAGAGAALSSVADRLINGTNAIVTAVKSAIPANQVASRVSADDVIRQAAQDHGIDLSAIPQGMMNDMRNQVADALSSNKTLDAAALLRRAEGENVLGPQNGLTLGQATRDPGQFTQEKNLRGINGVGEPLMQRYSGQNNALIGALNQRGAAAAPGEFNAGQGAIDALQAQDQAASQRVSGLYDQARALNGGDILLDHVPVIQQAGQALDANMAGAFVPANIRNIMNSISTGETPLTLSTAEQLKTIIGRAQSSSQDGNERYALGIIRNALDQAQPAAAPARMAAGGNQIVPAATGLGGANPAAGAQEAFSRARAAAASRFGTIEQNPALGAVVNGDAVPDNFFKRYILNGNVGDVNSLLGLVPDQGAALRAQVVDHLKQKALNGASDEVGVFSQAGYNKALNSLGDAKLSALFSPDEVAQLKQIGRVAANLQAQPAGSAVNHSNTGAAVANVALAALDKVGKLPGLNIARNSINQFLSERAVGRAVGGQIAPTSNPGVKGSLNSLLPLAAPLGGIIAAQPAH